jgi:hypothetical protein
VSAANGALGGCAWRRCSHAATAVVAFQVPHPLAGTRRGYCDPHAGQVADQPAAVLATSAGGVPVQPELPGIEDASTAWPPQGRGGRW